MIEYLKKIIIREQFEPSLLGIFLNPFYISRVGLLQLLKKNCHHVTGKTLDVGCGTKPYEKYFQSTEYIGLEIDTTINRDLKKADYYYDGKIFPFENNTFDSIVCNQVLEHVFNPMDFIREINRVMKPNGKILLTVPFVWDEHEQPYDYARYSSFGLKHLFEQNGFKVITIDKSQANIKVIFQLINTYLYKKTHNIPVIKQFVTLTFMALTTILGLLLGFILAGNCDLYLDNVMIAEKN